MTLDNIQGNLLKYKELELGTFQHSDQLTTERRTNPITEDGQDLRNLRFYTADGSLYTVQKGKSLWAITREPENLVLQNIDEAYPQLVQTGNYFPDAKAGQSALEHDDTVVAEIERLELEKENSKYGHFVINPKKTNKLNSQKKLVAQRIFGPDEENFGLNMEMFAKACLTPLIYVLTPSYVQKTLKENDKEFLGRASWLNDFDYFSNFSADGHIIYDYIALRGVRKAVVDTEKEIIVSTPKERKEIITPTMEEILSVSRNHVTEDDWEPFQNDIDKLYRRK
jgi:hypothetical protein